MAMMCVGLAFSVMANIGFITCWLGSTFKRCTRRKVNVNINQRQPESPPQHESTKFYDPQPHIYRPQPTRNAPTLAPVVAPATSTSTRPIVNQSTLSSDLEVSFDLPPPQ